MGIKVLSLCDGIATGRYALEQLGIPVDVYYASEIEESAIKIAKKNYPDIIEIGDVNNVDGTQYRDVDLVMFGSPCQSLSIVTSKNRKNLDGKSKLFFECHRVLKEVNPKWFLMENVASMKGECKDIISHYMGVQPVFVNSSYFSAQERERYYWTNIPLSNFSDLKPSKEVLKDIMLPESEVDEKFYYSQGYDYIGDRQVCATLHINGHDLIKRVHSPNYKCHTLVTCTGGNRQKKVLVGNRVRKLTPIEYERLQTLPDGYTEGVSMTARYNALGNGWTAKVIMYLLSGICKDILK